MQWSALATAHLATAAGGLGPDTRSSLNGSRDGSFPALAALGGRQRALRRDWEGASRSSPPAPAEARGQRAGRTPGRPYRDVSLVCGRECSSSSRAMRCLSMRTCVSCRSTMAIICASSFLSLL